MGKVKLAILRKQNEVVRSDLQCIILGSDERRKSCIIGTASPSPAGNGTGMYSVRTQAVVRDWRTVGAGYADAEDLIRMSLAPRGTAHAHRLLATLIFHPTGSCSWCKSHRLFHFPPCFVYNGDRFARSELYERGDFP